MSDEGSFVTGQVISVDGGDDAALAKEAALRRLAARL